MLEFPEALVISNELKKSVVNKKVSKVYPPTKAHKFCWFCGDPVDYDSLLNGKKIIDAISFGGYVEIIFEDDLKMCVNDGINLRLQNNGEQSKDYQLKILFEDDSVLVFTVAMYGGIYLYKNTFDYSYYIKNKQSISPLSPDFKNYFYEKLSGFNKKQSVKAFLATEQRFCGIGNGVLQDILFNAKVNPKTKMINMDEQSVQNLYNSVVDTLGTMVKMGGRDTEKDLFGVEGGYKTIMSKKTCMNWCVRCGCGVVKETYLGGSVYYCPNCQKELKDK